MERMSGGMAELANASVDHPRDPVSILSRWGDAICKMSAQIAAIHVCISMYTMRTMCAKLSIGKFSKLDAHACIYAAKI